MDLFLEGGTPLDGAGGAGVKRVRLLERVLEQIEEQIRGARFGSIGGLLLGQKGESPWIERVLACRNAAGEAAGQDRYEIDPKVVSNVEKSLEGKPIEIVGVYHATGRQGEGVASLEPSWIEEGPLWLFARVNGAGLEPPRVLRRDAGYAGAEVAVEVVRPPPVSRVVCPE